MNERIEKTQKIEPAAESPFHRSPAMWIGVSALAAVFFVSGLSIVIGLDQVQLMFEHWGFPLWFMTAVGFLEVLCAVALMSPRSTFVGSVALIFLMSGAVLTHLMSAEYTMAPVPFLLAFALAYVAYRHRPQAVVTRETYVTRTQQPPRRPQPPQQPAARH